MKYLREVIYSLLIGALIASLSLIIVVKTVPKDTEGSTTDIVNRESTGCFETDHQLRGLPFAYLETHKNKPCPGIEIDELNIMLLIANVATWSIISFAGIYLIGRIKK